MRRALPLLLALSVAVGCGSSDGSSGPGDTSVDIGGATSVTRDPAATPSSAPSSSDTTAPPGPTAFTAQAADAANELKAAWEAGDRPRALAIAPADVVEALFLVPPAGFEIYGCDTGEFDTSTCNFRNRSTGVYIPVTMERHEQGWQVATVYVGD